jgi:hypothetical protein
MVGSPRDAHVRAVLSGAPQNSADHNAQEGRKNKSPDHRKRRKGMIPARSKYL